MECSCGGSMKSGRAERTKHAAVLEYLECKSCGRCHFDALRIGGKLVATGEDARRQFEDFDAPAPADPQPTRKDELNWRPTAEQPPRDQLIRVDYLTGGYCVGHGWFFDAVWDLVARWAPCRSDEGLIPWPNSRPKVGVPFDFDATPEVAIQPTTDLPPVGANFCFPF